MLRLYVGMSATLYERLGGRESIRAVVDEFYDRVLADDRVNGYFEETDVAALRAHQTGFLVAVAGGPDAYEGRDLAEAHAGLGIDAEAFAVVATHLDETLLAFDVPDRERSEVMDAVGSLEPAVVSG